MMGLEPTTFGTTIRRSNQLSYNHRVYLTSADIQLFQCFAKIFLDFYFKSVKLLTATYLSTVKPSAYSEKMSLPKSFARYSILSVKFFVAIGDTGSLEFGS